MTTYSKAVWEPENSHGGAITPTTIIVHSNAGHSQDPGAYMDSEGLSATFQVATDGTVYEYVDASQEAYANVSANAFAISIETENSAGYPNNPTFDGDTWQEPQRTALLALIDWCCTTYGIPRTLCTSINGGGIGWHEQFPEWTTQGHHCPGNSRVHQLQADIIPALNSMGDDMFTDADRALLTTVKKALDIVGPELAKVDQRTWQMRLEEDTILKDVTPAQKPAAK